MKTTLSASLLLLCGIMNTQDKTTIAGPAIHIDLKKSIF